MTKNCKITHAITKDSYPSMPHLASNFKIGDTLNIHKIYYRNGEDHIKGTVNGILVEVPVMWTNWNQKVDNILNSIK